MSNRTDQRTMPVLLRMTTVPLSLKYLIAGQMSYMRQHGFEVHMASADGPEREAVMSMEETPHHIIPMTRRITPLRDVIALGTAVRLMREIRPDIVHTHTPKAGLIGMLAARWTGVPVRIHTLAGLPMITAGRWKKNLLRRTEQWTYSLSTEVWPNNRALQDYILKEQMTRANKCRVIGSGSSNGVDLTKWSLDAVDHHSLDELKNEIDYSEGNTYFLFVGRLVRDKGLPDLIRAFISLHASDESIHLILAGSVDKDRSSEHLPPDCTRAIAREPFIHSVGWSHHIREWMALSDALVFPSHREGFPNVLLQAGAMKLPVLCSDIPEHKSLITEGENGILFPTTRERALVDAVHRFLKNPARVAQMVDRLYRKVQHDFRREDVHREILEQYKSLLRERSI